MGHPARRMSAAAPRCPSCPGQSAMDLQTSPDGHSDSNDLLEWRCSTCGHKGYTASLGLQLVFRGEKEYIFTFGHSMATLTVRLSSPAVGLFRSHLIGADELASRTAEWALLHGRKSGIVSLGLQDDLADFYLFFSKKTSTTDGQSRHN